MFIYWLGGHNLRPGRKFKQIYTPGKPPGPILPGHLDRALRACTTFIFCITKLCKEFSVLVIIAIWCNKRCHSSSVLIVNTDPEIKARLENSIQGRHKWIGNLKLVKLIDYSKILKN